MPTNKNIKVAMLEMSPQNKAILEFYFDRAGKSLYKVVHKDVADTLIIDYDQFGAKEHVSEILAERNIPILLISIKEQNIASTIWLAKPLSADALNKAATSINEMLAEIPENTEVVETQVETEAENTTSEVEEIESEAESQTEAEATAEHSALKTEQLEVEAETEIDTELTNLEVEQVETEAESQTEVEATAEHTALKAEQLEVEAETEIDTELTNLEVEQVETEAEKETEKEISVEEDNIEVLSDAHLEEDELFLDDSIAEMSTSDEKVATEDFFEIDELAVEDSQVEASSVEKQKAEENKTADSGLAIAGVAASALAATSLLADDDFTNDNDINGDDNLLSLDAININNEAKGQESTDLDIALSDDSDSAVDEDDEVDSLLDSLISEEDETEQVLENTVDEVEEDAFIENLLLDPEFEDDVEKVENVEKVESVENLNNVVENDSSEAELEIDVLKSVDTELEDNISLQNTLTPDTDNKSDLIDENFTLHDDLDPSTEDVFADTLEVKYDDVKDNKEKPVTEPKTNEQATEIKTDLGEAVENDFNFDFEALENKEFVNAETPDTKTEGVDDFELTLLDEVNEKQEAVSEADATATADELDTDLDSLLKEVAEDNGETLDASSKDMQTELEPEIDTITTEAVTTTPKSAVTDINDDISAAELTENDLAGDDLQSLLNEVREEANSSMAAETANDGYEQTQAEKRWMQLCGNEQDIKSQKEVTKNGFDPEKHLLGVILKQIQETKKDKEQLFRLKYNDLIIVIDHSQSKIYCNSHITSDEFSVFCTNEHEPEKIKIHDLDYSEVRLYRNKIEKNPKRAHSFESFIWTTSLLTSRGRLPANTSISKTIGLKTWPDLTRMEAIPHAMNIAAVFAKHPGTLLEIPDWLNIQQRYVFAFYNAALALDMIDFDSKKAKKSGFSFGKKASKAQSEERGFFGRLLKRLKT